MVRKTERQGSKDDKGNMASAGDKVDATMRMRGQLTQQRHVNPSASVTISYFRAQRALQPYNQQSSTVAAASMLSSLKQLLPLHELMRAARWTICKSAEDDWVICVSSAGNLRCKRGCVGHDRGTFKCEEGREDEGTSERQVRDNQTRRNAT